MAAHKMVKKRPKVDGGDGQEGGQVAEVTSLRFDRAALLQQLFALPIPPPRTTATGSYREYPIHTPLGRIMRLRELMIRDVEKWEGAPNSRRMSDYLAGRVKITREHRNVLADNLGVDRRLL